MVKPFYYLTTVKPLNILTLNRHNVKRFLAEFSAPCDGIRGRESPNCGMSYMVQCLRISASPLNASSDSVRLLAPRGPRRIFRAQAGRGTNNYGRRSQK